MSSASSSASSSAPAAGAAGAPPKVYVIPVPGEDPIVLPSNELPADSNELSEVLLAVSAPLGTWVELLNEYYRQGKVAEYEKLLRKTLNNSETQRGERRTQGTRARAQRARAHGVCFSSLARALA
jgi:hypothetical protein